MRRWLGVALLSTFVGCYPEFGFVSSDAATANDSATSSDSSVADADNDAIFPTDDTDVPQTDSSSDSGTVVDTAKPDTFVPPVDMGTPPTPGCAGLTGWFFCRDFDLVTSVGSGWTGTYTTGTGAVSLETTKSYSPSKSMKSSLSVSSTVAAGNAHYDFVAPSSTRPLAVDMWVWFDKIPTADGPMTIKIARDSANRGVSLYLGAGGLAVDVNAPSGTTNHRAPGVIGAGKWEHVRLETQLSATTAGWFKLYVNDMVTPKLTRTGIATTTVDGTDIKINVGFYIDVGQSINGWFDDVAFYWL